MAVLLRTGWLGWVVLLDEFGKELRLGDASFGGLYA
jgi:hypothetical protein